METPAAPVAAQRNGARRDGARHKGAPAWLGAVAQAGLALALCLGLTWHLWRDAQRVAEQDLQSTFDARARELVNRLDQRMAAVVQVLRGVQGVFSSSDSVTRDEFVNYVRTQDLGPQFPAMLGIGYVATSGQAGQAPLLYLEQIGRPLLPGAGADAFADPARRMMLERARDSGQAAMSAMLDVGPAGAAPPVRGVYLALPVYQKGAATASLDQRRAALRGWIFAPLRLDVLMRHVIGEGDDRLDIAVHDGDTAQATAALPLRTSQAISIGGHRWTLAIGAPAAFQARLNPAKPRLILGAGLMASVLLTLLTWMLARSNASTVAALERARLLARELESGQKRLVSLADSAQRAQAMLRSILDSTIDGILVDNGERRVLASNQRFRELWSVPAGLDMSGDDHALVQHLLSQLAHPAPFLYSRSLQYQDNEEHRDLLRMKDGRFFEQFTRAVMLGPERARLWSFRDITERKQIEQRERSHRHVLELLARSAPLAGILDAVALGVEATNPGMLCAIQLLDTEGRRLSVGAAPSLPDFFSQALGGPIPGPGAGACGSAAFSGVRVIVEDIARHPAWEGYRELAGRAELAAAWSQPIRGASGKVLGTFAIYHREPQFPSAANVVLLEQSAQLAGIAVEQAQAAQALRVGEERFRSLYDHAPVALWEQDWSAVRAAWTALQADGVGDVGDYLRAHPLEAARLARLVRIMDVNAAALAQVGAHGKDLMALGLGQNFAYDAGDCFIEAVSALAGGAQLFACESSFLRLDGVARQNALTMLVMPGHAHTLAFVIVSTVDITERKRMDAELLVLATTDFLTGLPNRREFMTRLDDELARVQRNVNDQAAVLMLDIDHFKTVNDEFGHATGDAVLRHMAGLMRAGQRKIDTLGRVGGEEFAVLLPGADAAAAAAYAERLRKSVAETPLEYEGTTIAITVSIGMAGIHAADQSADAALIRADKALYRAKQAGRNRVAVQDPA